MRRRFTRYLERLEFAIGVGMVVLAADQLSKGIAQQVHAANFVQNPSVRGVYWAGPLIFLATLLLPFRPFAALSGAILGSSFGNLLDHWLWPGGVPDFIRHGDTVYNLADAVILVGLIALVVWVPLWSLWQLRRLRPRDRWAG